MQRQRTLFPFGSGRKWLVAAVSCFFLVGLAACGGGGGGGATSSTPEMTITPTPTGDDHPDTIAGAVAIVDGETVDGSLDSPDDEDFFRLDVPEGTSVIDVTLQAEAGVEVALLDSEGVVLGVTETASRTESAGPVAPAAVVAPAVPLLAAGLRIAVQGGGYVIRLAATPAGRAAVARGTKKLFKLAARVKKAESVVRTVVNLVRGIPDVEVPIRGAVVRIDFRQHFSVDGVPSPGLKFRVAVSAGLPKIFSKSLRGSNLGLKYQIDNHIMKLDDDSGATDGRVINVGVSAEYSIPGTEGVVSIARDVFKVTMRAREENGGGMQPGGPSPRSPSYACLGASGVSSGPGTICIESYGDEDDGGFCAAIGGRRLSQCPRTPIPETSRVVPCGSDDDAAAFLYMPAGRNISGLIATCSSLLQ